jgi:hypothetical protein
MYAMVVTVPMAEPPLGRPLWPGHLAREAEERGRKDAGSHPATAMPIRATGAVGAAAARMVPAAATRLQRCPQGTR